MMQQWNKLKSVKKFTPRTEVDRLIGAPVFQLENRPAYYYGKGIVVYFTSKCFRIQGIERVEYGVPGEYAVGVYHFSEPEALKTELGLDTFDADDAVPLEEDIAEGAVSYASTLDEVRQWARKNPSEHCQEGETRRLAGGKMIFKNMFIMYGQYEFFFYGKSKQTKLTGFRFVLNE